MLWSRSAQALKPQPAPKPAVGKIYRVQVGAFRDRVNAQRLVQHLKDKGFSDWEFVRVYIDEGISATNTKKRDGFKQMVADALDGQIDLIITKSVNRFAIYLQGKRQYPKWLISGSLRQKEMSDVLHRFKSVSY